ncbi:MAG: hypothetical protein JNJ47_05840 [Alphaproteobacteria bacterium]|nr:hypothetical protein [Alphaproteobacteria bacterium]
MTLNVPPKKEMHSGGMKSLSEKIEEFKQRLPLSSHHTNDEDDEWE